MTFYSRVANLTNYNFLYDLYLIYTNLIARVSQMQRHEIRIELYALLDNSNCLLY